MNVLTEPKPDTKGLGKEQRRLYAHRTLGLMGLGFSLTQTIPLARRNDVVHEAEALLERGWPHEFVVDELMQTKE